MTVGALARRTGLSIKAIRQYEGLGGYIHPMEEAFRLDHQVITQLGWDARESHARSR